MAHQPSRDVGCISCSQEFPSRSQGPPCAHPPRQHIGGLLHKSPGGFAVTSTLQTGMPNPPVVPREVVVFSSSLHPGGPQYRSRHLIETGAESQGMEAPPRGGGADMEGVCVSRDFSLSTLVLPHASSSSWAGCDGVDMAEASYICISPDRSAPGSPGESSPGPGSTTSHYPRWPDRIWFTFTFMHLADAFIQSDLQLNSGYTFLISMAYQCGCTLIKWYIFYGPFL